MEGKHARRMKEFKEKKSLDDDLCMMSTLNSRFIRKNPNDENKHKLKVM